MKAFLAVLGTIIVLVLLVTNGIVGGALCIKGVGCAYSNENGAAVDDSQTVVVSTRR